MLPVVWSEADYTDPRLQTYYLYPQKSDAHKP
jgi:hypothetical protein